MRLAKLISKIEIRRLIICRTMSKNHPIKMWQPCETLLKKKKHTNYGVVVLNTPIKHHPNFLVNLWKQAQLRVTVDGGTNQWLSWLRSNNIELEPKLIPELITGDLDSISEESLNCLSAEQKTLIVRTPNQNETDFTKSLREINEYCMSRSVNLEEIYVIVDTSGRFDQIMANICTLFRANTILPNINLFQIASNSLTWVLHESKHEIRIPDILRQNHEWCALMPILKPTRVTTTGLKWNLNDTEMEFGHLVSTSNTYNGSPVVTVETEHPIVWSMGIQSLPLDKQSL